MTGPEHYTAAEDLLLTAAAYEQDGAPLTAASRRAEAQVHATLAAAAATANQTAVFAMHADINSLDVDTWYEVSGTMPERDEVTNADVIGADELYEMDRAAEFAHDAAADELDGGDPR